MQAEFKLLVFDWDGTLMDSEAQIVGCMQSAMRDLDLEPLAEASIRDIIGLGLREALETLFPGSAADFQQQLVARYRHHFLSAGRLASPLFGGAEQTLRALHAQGYLLAVATGKGRPGLDKVLDETGLGPMFVASRCADETASKPDPRMLLELMSELDVSPEHTLMIGDTEYDMLMARNARVASLAVAYGVHARERLLQHQPLGCLEHITEMSPWLAARTAAWPGDGHDSKRENHYGR